MQPSALHLQKSQIAAKFIIMCAVIISCFSAARASGLWRLLFPSRDLFNLLVNENIDITCIGAAISADFTLKYDGPYTAGILLTNLSSPRGGDGIALALRMRIDFSDGEQLKHSVTSGAQYTPFIGLTGNALSLVEFRSPEDVPKGRPIKCVATIVTPDASLANKYGTASFFVQKRSDNYVTGKSRGAP